MGKLYHRTDLDVGLALAHMHVASEYKSLPFQFHVEKNNIPAPPKDFTYLGTVSLPEERGNG